MRKGMGGLFLLFLLLSCICIPIYSSSLNQDSDLEFPKKTSRPLLCSEKYITELYFRHHESLVDSNFQEFLSHSLPLDSEKPFPGLSNLGRDLIGEGSHRSLSSSIRFSIQGDLIPDLISHFCEIIIIEKLPNGVFADPFELEHLLQQRVFNDVSVFGDINLELPSFRSNRSVVELHLNVDVNKTSGRDIVQELKIELPLHSRYPHVDGNGYSKVAFGLPDLFYRCKSHELSAAQNCLLTRISGDPKVEPIVWLIPGGIKAHARLVSLVTFGCAILSAILIIFMSLKQSHSVSGRRLKQK